MSKEKIIDNRRIIFRKPVNCWAMLILLLGFSASIASGMPEAPASHVLSGMQLLQCEMAEKWHSNNYCLPHRDVDTAIGKAISFLKESQLPSGEFQTYVSLSHDMADKIYLPQVFSSAIVLHSLSFVESDSEINEMRNKTAVYILANKEEPGVWRFYGKYSSMPPDLDDTSVAFASLKETGISVEESGLEYALNYRNQEGLFYTWMNEEKWMNESDPFYLLYKNNDIDPVVNANMLYGLSLAGEQAPEVSDYLNSYIENNSFTEATMYYHIPYIQLYTFSRAYADGHAKDLELSMPVIRNYLLNTQRPDGSWGNEINTSMAAISLMNSGYKGKALDRAITYILNTQRSDGSWPEIGVQSLTFYYGSEEFTTAFSLEALSKYDDLHNRKWQKMMRNGIIE